MMLLDMVTADAAAKHGHGHAHAHGHGLDFALPPRLPSPADTLHGAYSLAQMPLSLLGSVLRCQSAPPAPAPSPSQHAPDAASPMPADEPAPSRPASAGSSTVAEEKPRRKAPRSKTSYILAHPPPTVHARAPLHIRPKVQLQLHQVLAAERPKPVYDVIPFSLLAPRSTRRLARSFNTRERLGHNDLLVVRAAAYGHSDDDHKSDDERWGSREVVAVISPGKTERGQVVSHTEICMDDGTSRWEVSHLPNGGFEFNTLDEHGLALKARWVAKPPSPRRLSSLSVHDQPSPSPSLPPAKEDAKWNFSTISASSRRHPVIASMTRTRIHVNDAYTLPAATQPSTPDAYAPASPALTPASIDAASFLDAAPRFPIVTEEALRRFIVVSGIWVSSLHHNYELASSPLAHLFNPSACIRPVMERAVSMTFLDSPRSASPASILENEKSIPKLLRNTSQILSRNSSFSDPPASPMSARAHAPPSVKARSRRANSTGTHSLYSMTGSLKKRYGGPFQVETLSETEEDKESKGSDEFSKQLVLPTSIEVSPVKSSAVEARSRPPALSIPAPSVIRPSTDGPASSLLLPSPRLSESGRTRRTQSAYNPITTAGMWDSGVTEGPGLKTRPTSMFVMNERKKREEKKRGRSTGRTKVQERRALDRSISKESSTASRDNACTGMKRKLKSGLKGMFGRKEKA